MVERALQKHAPDVHRCFAKALADRLVSEIDEDGFWVFAYGSLIWNPGFDHIDMRRSVAQGWRRSFCLNLVGWRATPQVPGLMLALQRGGACVGVAYRLPDDEPHARMMRLLRREINYHEDVAWLRWLTLRGADKVFRALTFYCAAPGDPDFVNLDVATQATRMARAVGPAGSCAEYLYKTVSHLEALGIRDRYLWQLQQMVAAQIEAL